MKKILASLAVFTITSSIASPILTTMTKVNLNKKTSTNNANNYQPYQTQIEWENYMNKNKDFLNIIKTLNHIPSNYSYQKSTIVLTTINVNNIVEPIGTLLMNGKIQTTVGNPNMASQHIIDNSQGSNPLTINYDSKTVTNTSIVTATFSTDISASITASESFGLPFDNASISTTLAFNTSQSNSSTSSVQETVTFDKFSTTIKAGDKEEIDYVVMQNNQIFNMALKAKVDLKKSSFDFVNTTNSNDIEHISWFSLASNSQQSQIFAKETSSSIDASGMKKNLHPLIIFAHLNDPTIPIEKQNYDASTAYIYYPLSFIINGYSTLITQSKL